MKKRIVVMLAVFFLTVGIATPAFATSYSLNIPYPFAGSMQSTSLAVKLAGESPYVSPSINTIATCYFLSPQRISSTQATDIVTTGSLGSKSFTYLSGYGGVGQNYCLSAYPGVTGVYDPYNVRGSWSR